MNANVNTRPRWWNLIVGSGLLLIALFLIAPRDLRRETIRLQGPRGKPCLGTIWTPSPLPESLKGVVLLGHGFTFNQGVMATAAKAFVHAGYIAVTFDFWGHGRSREKFGWTIHPTAPQSDNPAQVQMWCQWAHERFPGLRVAYLGHSMGGFAGAVALSDKPNADAFVAMGALPRQLPSCKTAIAAGRFEELFSIEEARQQTRGQADIVTSPFSDHALEAWDPILLHRIIAWVDKALGFQSHDPFAWYSWATPFLAAALGCAAALVLAEYAAACMRPTANLPAQAPADHHRRANPYRLAARLLGLTGEGTPPRTGSLISAIVRGLVFSVVFIALLSWVLKDHIFTCDLTNPGRCLTWLVLTPLAAWLSIRNAGAQEQAPLSGAMTRFAVGALVRGVPLLALCIALRLIVFRLAFLGMVLGMLAFIFVMLAAVYAMATRGARDYRAGAIASGTVLAWVITFWLPQFLG